MMPIGYPTLADPSQVQLNMPAHPHPPPPPPLPVHSKSRVLDILKLLIVLLIALILGAILVVLLFARRTGNEIDLRESNEQIAKLQRESNENIARLQRESNENIARLQREQQISMENERQKHQDILIQQQLLIEKQRFERQENLTEIHRLEDRLIEKAYREQDLQRAIEQSRQQLEIELKRYELLLEERNLTEQHRKEDLSQKHADLISDFMEEVILTQKPLDRSVISLKVHSLLRRLDTLHKSVLINNLYQAKLLIGHDPNNIPLDLSGADLKDIDLDGIDIESGQIGPSQSYNQLVLSSTNLINASFDHLYLYQANFSSSDMKGISFRSSKLLESDLSNSELSLSDFRNADVSQSIFSNSKIQRASFQNAMLFQTQMNNVNIESTNFQSIKAIDANFSQSEMSNADFQHAEISYARMDYVSVRSANFYSVKAIETNFTHAYMPECSFQWANLREASFRYAVLLGANFENADVQNIDFTRALLAGVRITPGQLDVVLSITNATLPDGSMGKNKNLVKNSHAQCSDINGTISNWITNETVFINGNLLNNDCAFQATEINGTLQQSIDISRYSRLIAYGQGNVYIEMQDKTTNILNPSVYMIVRFFDKQKTEITGEISSLNMGSSTPAPTFTARFPCPSNTVELQVTLVFRQAKAAVDNIYVTIE